MAISLSRKNMLGGFGPFGAVVVKDGKVIAKRANKVVQTIDPTAHAEVAAIRAACRKLKTFDLSGCVVYTSCEPCPMCLGALYWARVDKVYYANTKHDAQAIDFSDHFIYEEISLPMEKRKLPFIQLLREEALEVFELWKRSEDKRVY